MPHITDRPPGDDGPEQAPLGRRLAWFAGLWLAGLAVTAALAYGLRALLFL